jgi:hypothetical protein
VCGVAVRAGHLQILQRRNRLVRLTPELLDSVADLNTKPKLANPTNDTAMPEITNCIHVPTSNPQLPPLKKTVPTVSLHSDPVPEAINIHILTRTVLIRMLAIANRNLLRPSPPRSHLSKVPAGVQVNPIRLLPKTCAQSGWRTRAAHPQATTSAAKTASKTEKVAVLSCGEGPTQI